MKHTIQFLVVVFLFAVVIIGCKNDSTAPGGGGGGGAATTYIGTIGGSQSGVLTLNFSSAPHKQMPSSVSSAETVLTLTGTIKVGSVTTNLTGTYNTADSSLFLEGGNFFFSGKWTGTGIIGSYTYSGSPAGYFSVVPAAQGTTIKVYLGSYQETSPATTNHGTLNITVNGTAITVNTGDGSVITGTLIGNAITIYEGSQVIANGTLNGTTMSGTYNVPSSGGTESGTWTATLAQ